VFGYGSLAGLPGAEAALVVHAAGWRRSWNVAMDNRRRLPGYKQYLDPVTGEAPPVQVTFLNLVRDRGTAVNGVLVAVEEPLLAELDRRERNYRRVEFTGRLSESTPGRVWAYVGTPAARRRYEQGRRRGTAVVEAGYLEFVEDGFRRFGADVLGWFRRSTDRPSCPVRRLRRVELDDIGD
jgi:cation transport regulator ChaC